MHSESREPLDLFPCWLQELSSDARAVASSLLSPHLSTEQRVWLAGALNYLLRSVDLIPDGVEDLGYLDDAFVIRYAIREAFVVQPFESEELAELTRLAQEAENVGEFLGDEDASRLGDYVSGLRISKVRGRSPSDVGEDENLARQVIDEVASWAESYCAPSFNRDEKTLVKLRSFLSTKLA
jgi:uncharacterized membrane protein YkvA (DUF1232 family)